MKVVILLGAFVLSMLSINALSAEKPKDPWYEVSSNAAGDAKILAKLDTVKKDETGVSVLIQYLVKDLPGGNFSVKYYQMSISKKACDDGYGEVLFSPVSKKKQDEFSSEYVEGGQSLGSFAAECLCYLYKKKAS